MMCCTFQTEKYLAPFIQESRDGLCFICLFCLASAGLQRSNHFFWNQCLEMCLESNVGILFLCQLSNIKQE